MTLNDLRTPAVLIDKARALRNIDRMQSAASARGIRMRPHAKTHKSPVVAAWQLERGAAGICCAKLGEAEVFADAGIGDIRLPYPLNPVNADRVIALARRIRLSFIVNHPQVAEGWSAALGRAGAEVDVLVKVDVGFHRCGIDPALASAVPFISRVAAMPGLRLKGLLSHAGHAYHASSEEDLQQIAASEASTLCGLAEAARRAGVAIDELSAGATPTARYSLQQDGLTEYRAGNYVYFDRTQVALGAASLDDCALTVLARVVSKPARDRLVLDSGSKTLSNDGARGFAPAAGYGIVLRVGAGDAGTVDTRDAGTEVPALRTEKDVRAVRTDDGRAGQSAGASARSAGATGRSAGASVRSAGASVRSAGASARSAGATGRSAGASVRSAGASAPASPDEDLVIERLSEEHAVVRAKSGQTDLEPGDLVRIVPNHSCVVSNLVDQAWLVDGERVEPLPIAARGRLT